MYIPTSPVITLYVHTSSAVVTHLVIVSPVLCTRKADCAVDHLHLSTDVFDHLILVGSLWQHSNFK